MDLKRLRYFVTVAQLGSFTRAAQALQIAQPPLSQRIQELESEVGLPLLDRESRPLKLTPAGQLLFEQAVPLLQKTESMVASMRRLASAQAPTFTFGVVPANFHGNLATIMRRLRKALPGVELRILEMNSLQQAEALLEGRIDAGISRMLIDADGVERVILREEPMVVALPFDHALATMEEAMPLQALCDEPFIIYTSKPRPSLADHVLEQLRARGLQLSHVIEVNQYDTALLLIAAGCGVSIVPASARLVSSPAVAFRPLAEPFTSPFVLCHRRDDPSAELQALRFVLAQFLAERGHPVPVALQMGIGTVA